MFRFLQFFQNISKINPIQQLIVLIFEFQVWFFTEKCCQPNKNNKFFTEKWIKDMKKNDLRSLSFKTSVAKKFNGFCEKMSLSKSMTLLSMLEFFEVTMAFRQMKL